MNFKLDALSLAFWAHFRHLRVIDVDEDGVELRCLTPSSCIPCRRLWDSLTPLKVHGREVFPASKAERYRPFGRQVFLREDLIEAGMEAEAERSSPKPPVSVERVRRFTDYDPRRPLERY